MCVRMARISPLVSLAADDLEQVVRWEAAPSTPQQVALRCRLVLAAASGKQDLEIASIYDVIAIPLPCGASACAPPGSVRSGRFNPAGDASPSMIRRSETH